jgi:hypothetical protein
VRTNKSSIVAANETLTTTKCYFSVMDNDMESLSLTDLDHRRELRIFKKSKTANISFPPKFFIGFTLSHNLK